MGYIDQKPVDPFVPGPVKHRCPLPLVNMFNRVGKGSKWQCDECSKVWVFDPFREPFSYFILGLFHLVTFGIVIDPGGWVSKRFIVTWYICSVSFLLLAALIII